MWFKHKRGKLIVFSYIRIIHSRFHISSNFAKREVSFFKTYLNFPKCFKLQSFRRPIHKYKVQTFIKPCSNSSCQVYTVFNLSHTQQYTAWAKPHSFVLIAIVQENTWVFNEPRVPLQLSQWRSWGTLSLLDAALVVG